MVALGLVTTEHLEGKMSYVVLQFSFWVKSFLYSAAKRNWWFCPLKGSEKSGEMLPMHSCAFQPQNNGWPYFALPPIPLHSSRGTSSRRSAASTGRLGISWHLRSCSRHGPLKDVNNWRMIVKQKACKGSDQHWSHWRISEVQRRLPRSSVASMPSPLSPCEVGLHFLS